MVLDEGHQIRNAEAEISILCKRIPSFHRIILTGTPIQNSLKELWSLFDFVCPGLLGNMETFETDFALPIRWGGYSNASSTHTKRAYCQSMVLRNLIQPFLLRRIKQQVEGAIALPSKTEKVIFCLLSPNQRALYRTILQSRRFRRMVSREPGSVLPSDQRRAMMMSAISVLRKLCNHKYLVTNPRGDIVWRQEWNQYRKSSGCSMEEDSSDIGTLSNGKRKRPRGGGVLTDSKSTHQLQHESMTIVVGDHAKMILEEGGGEEEELLFNMSFEGLVSGGGKLGVLVKILDQWYDESKYFHTIDEVEEEDEESKSIEENLGNKVLLFTHSLVMLDIIGYLATFKGWSFLRMDGNTNIKRRQELTDQFNSDPSIFLFILTSKTGGLGLSLTAANKVILIDPDWNPQNDIQVYLSPFFPFTSFIILFLGGKRLERELGGWDKGGR